MTMLDDRNQPQPGSSDFGNWQKAATIGLFGMNPVVSFAGLGLVLGAGGMMMFLGPLPTLIYLVIAAVLYVPLAVKIEGKSVFARLVRRMSFRRARRRRETAYLGGPLSPQPQGRLRLPGLLAASRLYSAVDAYGEQFGFLRIPLTNSYPVIVRANADGDALVDASTVDTMIGTWSGFLQTLPQWPDIAALSVTIESVPDPGRKIANEVDRMRTQDAAVSEFTEAVFGELRERRRRRFRRPAHLDVAGLRRRPRQGPSRCRGDGHRDRHPAARHDRRAGRHRRWCRGGHEPH